jgi:nucleotide-binding universal stress UspA family protein
MVLMTEERMTPLLVPLDGSIPAAGPLEVAQAFAELRGDDIDVLFVSAEPLAAGEVAEVVGLPVEWLPRVTLLNTVGDPGEGICRVGGEIKADVILMSTHGRTGDLRSLVGSVTLKVLQDPFCCPVLVVRSALDFSSQARRLRHLRRICIPLDGSPEAAWSVRVGSALAQQANARILMLHVIDDRPRKKGRALAEPSYSDQPLYELEAWQEEFIRGSFAMVHRPREATTSFVLRFGDPDREVSHFAAETDCDLIVAAWDGNISAGRAKVVQMLLEQAPCPLLFVRARELQPSA